MVARKYRGFTLVELLVVISIIGVLMGLVLPAVQNTRKTARQAQCANNMRNLALAVLQFEGEYKRFPGYVNSVGPNNKAVNWVVPLFPYMERGDLWQIWSRRAYNRTSHKPMGIGVLQCPDNPPQDNNGALAYVVNGGHYDDVAGTENLANGVFFDHYPSVGVTSSLEYLAANDGAANTVMISENLQRRWFNPGDSAAGIAQYVDTWGTGAVENRGFHAFFWHKTTSGSGGGQEPGRMINMEKDAERADCRENVHARPSSHHAQGVNVMFCDGHGKFIAQSLDYGVYRLLMTSAGAYSDDDVGKQQNAILDDAKL